MSRRASKFLTLALVFFSLTSAFASANCMSAKERGKVFDQAWRLVGEKYYDPNFNGVDWNALRDRYRPKATGANCDDGLYAVLKEMAGSLHDAHTRFRSPAERARAHKLQATTPGLSISEVDGKPVIVNVESDSDASRAGVEAGMIITSVDGLPFSQRLSEVSEEVGESSSSRAKALLTYYEVLAGEPGTTVRLGVEREDGSSSQVNLLRHIVPISPPVMARVLPSGYGYIKFNLFSDTVAKEFREALARFGDNPGLIIDVRGNPGGDFNSVLAIANNFFGEKVSFGRVIARSGRGPSLMLRMLGVPSHLDVGGSSTRFFSGRIIILVNEASGSAAEIFAAGMQENHRAAVIGRQTCGCVLGSVAHSIRGGGEIDISEFGILTASGRKLEGVGVIPDVRVPLTLDDLRHHHDASLTEALAVLNSSNHVAREAEQ